MTVSHHHIQHLLTRAGLTEDDLLELIEGTLAEGEAAGVVGRLGSVPELSEMVWAMRADHQRLSSVMDLALRELVPDTRLVEAAVAIGVTGSIPPELAREIESSAIGRYAVHSAGNARRASGRAHGRRPGRFLTRGLFDSRRAAAGFAFALAACLVVGVVGVIVSAWPDTRPGFRPGTGIGRADPSEGAIALDASDGAAPLLPESPATMGVDLAADASGGRTIIGRGIESPTRIASAADALEAAREGRLIIRLVSADGAAARSLVETITTQPSISRVAVLEGAMSSGDRSVLAAALPAESPVIFASKAEGKDADGVSPRPVSARVPIGAYMLEVEPTERGFSLLLAGLGRDPTVLVQMVRSAEAVTTPGSVSDAVWYRSSSRDWQPRIAAPVVIETIGN